ncbi:MULTISPECIES: hypothetical protein [unclassified Comamonas]|uniref:hypothetical protein n=1 Tax=unclassified Comamonas TaxID=2638500 RepID=UPI001FA72BF7|nr:MULTISPECIES: hypothetical protein [unclassified Comamonas]UNV91848.1 hypothetical protein MP576_05690 [Comamonas sp. 7D-2evo1]UNV94850.1 hypothetical protein MPZ60_20650 [Comamonas sp. 7D-2]UNW01486.1 hypothetical protein MP579_05675 [Comamonas sp. 7D-2evo2]
MSDRIILTSGGVALDLPPDLIWVDELTASNVVQRSKRSAFGTLIISAMQLQGGQRITLQGEGGSAWIERRALKQIKQWGGVPGLRLELDIRGETFSVVFDHGDADETRALGMQSVIDFCDKQDDDYYGSLVLRFLEAGEQ